MLCHPYLVEMCEVIIYGNEHYTMLSDWFSADNKKNTAAHLKSLESFSFIYATVVSHLSLSYFREPILKGYRVSLKIYMCSALVMIKDCQKELADIRGDNEELSSFSDRIYSHSCHLAAKSGITPAAPRICQR